MLDNFLFFVIIVYASVIFVASLTQIGLVNLYFGNTTLPHLQHYIYISLKGNWKYLFIIFIIIINRQMHYIISFTCS